LAGLDALTKLQARILDTASRYVKAGGSLVYSTCTLNPDENERIVAQFLKEHSGFVCAPVTNVPKGAQITDNFVTLYPFCTGTDGFFVALLKKL
ncbi:MAG: 16S rRNA (cytosine(967)-C(5))-methyltransferase RsmB, partial [Ruthenibacterium sp.]